MKVFKSIAQAHKEFGITRLGSVSKTVKHKKSVAYGELTYSLYLAPANMSGYEVCFGRTAECTKLCLNESGMNTMNMNNDYINRSRISKTKLFFEEKQFFMDMLVYEINLAKNRAEKLGYQFSVRLNNTSDLSPLAFNSINSDGTKINILEIFPTVQFYDYTKVLNRFNLVDKYSNYDLTFSYTGLNTEICKEVLEQGRNVAVVFKSLPSEFMGYNVIDGDKYDMRYLDEKGVVVGLKYKRTRTKLPLNTKFVVQ